MMLMRGFRQAADALISTVSATMARHKTLKQSVPDEMVFNALMACLGLVDLG